MMKKENFVKIMNAARDYFDKVIVLGDVLRVDFEDNFLTTFVSDVIDVVDREMEDKFPAGWEWIVNDFAWIYNFGREGGYVINVNGEDRVITTAGELYDVLAEL